MRDNELENILKEVNQIFTEFQNHFIFEARLEKFSSLTYYNIFLEGETFDLYVSILNGELYFTNEYESDKTIKMNKWNKDIAFEKLYAYFDSISKRNRVKNLLNPLLTFFQKKLINSLGPF